MKILAIETSCDETAVAIVECLGDQNAAQFKILGNALLSQIELHKQYGGVVPNLAKREHQKNLPPLLEKSLQESGCTPSDIDVIAVTAGPGLEPALWVGITFAQSLALAWNKPLVAVNHMEGHLLSALTEQRQGDAFLQIQGVALPLLALLISGGHTELVLMKNWLEYELIGQTRDDAVGEAYDKVARMLDLPYPGGPEISKLAEEARRAASLLGSFGSGHQSPPDNAAQLATQQFVLPRPMIHDDTCDFSFAGLKTAVLYLLKDKKISEKESASAKGFGETMKKHIAHEFENAVSDVLWKKTARALEQTAARTLVIGGGVSANTHIRRVFTENIARDFSDVTLRIPAASLTGDNAIMIALAGYYRALRHEFVTDIAASGNLSLAKQKGA